MVPRPVFPDRDSALLKKSNQNALSDRRANRPLDWMKLDLYATNFDHLDQTTYGPAVYTKDSEGFVWFEGTVKWVIVPVEAQLICKLTRAFWPIGQVAGHPPLVAADALFEIVPMPDILTFACQSSFGIASVSVDVSGDVKYVSALVGSAYNGASISLSNIRYYAGVDAL